MRQPTFFAFFGIPSSGAVSCVLIANMFLVLNMLRFCCRCNGTATLYPIVEQVHQ